MGLSNRKFAELAGVSESAVRKARQERIAGAVLPDGTIDPDRALQLWGKNTDPSMQRLPTPPSSGKATDTTDASLKQASGPDVSIARAALIIEKAKREQIKRKREENSTVERLPTAALVQTLAREFRDGFMGFPDKYHAQIASELVVDPDTLQVDPHSMYEALAKYQRLHLTTVIDKIKVEVAQ